MGFRSRRELRRHQVATGAARNAGRTRGAVRVLAIGALAAGLLWPLPTVAAEPVAGEPAAREPAAGEPAAVSPIPGSIGPDGATAVAIPTEAAPAQTVPGSTVALASVSLRLIRGGLASPTFVTNAGDGSGRLFILEQEGRIRIYKNGSILATPFLNITGRVSCCGERGLLGLAFHPSYATNRKFFVFYTDNSGHLRIAEYHVSKGDPDRAYTTEKLILRIAHSTYGNHNGGMLAFGPEGYLYIATGDGGGSGNPFRAAENRASLLGKILRIDINRASGTRKYAIPSSNPYARSSTYRREIWSYGLRNPWRFSFDRSTGDIWIADVGQGRYEEVDRDLRRSGGGRARNFGWSTMEGRACYQPSSGCNTSGRMQPLAVYNHSSGRCSITGGYVYRGTAYPALRGYYFFMDYCSGQLFSVLASGASRQSPVLRKTYSGRNVSSFGQSQGGELYVVDHGGGQLLQVVSP